MCSDILILSSPIIGGGKGGEGGEKGRGEGEGGEGGRGEKELFFLALELRDVGMFDLPDLIRLFKLVFFDIFFHLCSLSFQFLFLIPFFSFLAPQREPMNLPQPPPIQKKKREEMKEEMKEELREKVVVKVKMRMEWG